MNAIYDSLFWRAVRGEVTARPPVWFMRQAGRSDPRYRALRASVPLDLEQLFQTPDIAAEISLLPALWGVDALIIFLDILSPLGPMGAPFVFRPGPQLEASLASVGDFLALHNFDMAREMPYVAETFARMRNATSSTVPLIGFAGAPLTLLAFMAEGGSPGAGLKRTRELLQRYPREMRRVLGTLTTTITDYLKYQCACGAHIVQLFESAAYLFTRAEYLEFALPCQQQIFEALRGTAPGVFFARVLDEQLAVTDLGAAGADIVSLSTTRSIREVREVLGTSAVVQGNLDNQLLAKGPLEAIAEAARACIEAGECRGHIFNLNHGILPHTPHDHVTFLVDYVKRYTKNS